MNFFERTGKFCVNLVYDYWTNENSPIPNALNPAFLNSFIKYEFSRFDLSSSLFEKHFGEPVAVWYGESVLEDFIAKKINIYEAKKEIPFKKDIYFYIVNVFGSGSSTFGIVKTYNEGKSFFNFIPETTKDLIRNNNNLFLFINYANEGTLYFDWFDVIHSDAKKYNIPTEKIIFCISDYDIDINYKEWFDNKKNLYPSTTRNQIRTLYINWSMKPKAIELREISRGRKTEFLNYSNECSVVTQNDIDNTKIRSKKFLLFNRRLRPHRAYLIAFLKHKNLLDQFDISYDMQSMECFEKIEHIVSSHFSEQKDSDIVIENYNYLKLNRPKVVIDYDNFENIWGFNFEKRHVYLNSYIQIVSETNFFEKGGYFSEKSWKPIGNLQPFIFIGPARGLQELKKLGFKTFSPFIDESYDLEENPEKRFFKIMNELERLSLIDIEEIHEWYNKIFFDVLIYNQNLLFSSPENEDIIKIINKRIVDCVNKPFKIF